MILYLDCSSGISGDMLVGSLLSLAGAREADPGPMDDVLRPALAAAGIDPRLVQLEDVRRGGFAALAFKVADQPGFATFDELIMSLYASDLEQPVADAVASVAERMAAAEAEVHGRDEEHLHELSDVDTAVDLISAATLLARLAPESIVASPPALGDGEIETAHGRLSVPAPAVLSLLSGLPTAGGAPAVPAGEALASAAQLGELTTPTGAALLAHYAGEFGGVPAGRVERIGYGAGRREVPGRPNVLRAILVDPAGLPDDASATPAAPEAYDGHGPGDHVVLEANVDDMTPELLAHAADALREAGALDVWMSQALMKKGRPGVVFHVLAAAADRERLARAVFAETTTFGLRVVPCGREYVEERRESVKIGKLKVSVRLSFVGGRLATASPEYEDVRRVAAAVGRPARVVYEAAQSAARSRFSGS
jgi:pyridinium-3,5-bisthiocarboxylic acid mononucleotide nickel chelatase